MKDHRCPEYCSPEQYSDRYAEQDNGPALPGVVKTLGTDDISTADFVFELVEFWVGAVDFAGENSHGSTTLIRIETSIGSDESVSTGFRSVIGTMIIGHSVSLFFSLLYPTAILTLETSGP